MELGTAYISILPSTRNFGKAVSNELRTVESDAKRSGKIAGDNLGDGIESGAKKGTGKLGGMLKAGLIGAAAAAGVAAGAVFMSSIGKASDLQQSKGGVDAVFKDQAAGIHAASKSAAQDLGLTQNAYNELATTLGAGLKNKGIDDYAGSTKNLITVGADLAAQFGGSTQDAVDALASAMRGESDPIEKYGVSLSESAIKAELAANGQDKLTGAALETAKTQARLSLITKQTGDAQGAFGRESDTLAGQQQRAAAQWDDLQAKIGTAFLPAISSAMSFVNTTAIPAITGLADNVKGFAAWVSDNSGWLLPIAAGIGAMAFAWGGYLLVTQGIPAAVTAAKVAMMALNATMAANPIGLVVAIIAGLVAAFIVAYNTSDEFRAIVDGALRAVWGVAKQVGAWFAGPFVDFFRNAGAWIGAQFDGIGQWFRRTGDDLRAAGQRIGDFFTKDVPGFFGKAADAIGAAFSGVKDKILAPIRTAVEWINKTFVGGINGFLGTIGVSWKVPKIPGFADGGYTGGGGKYQPAGIVHRGEVVFSQRDVAALGGVDVVEAIRTGSMPGYAMGGAVGGLNSVFRSRLNAWNPAVGNRYSVSVGYRSPATQARLYAMKQAGLIKHPVAAPGRSKHQLGLAADLSPSTSASHRAIGRNFGLYWPMAVEPWHVQPVGLTGGGGSAGAGGGAFDFGLKAIANGLIAKLPSVAAPWGDVTKKVLGKMADGLIDKLMGGAFDSGGWLQPGVSTTYNGTGTPEAVLTRPQWDIAARAIEVAARAGDAGQGVDRLDGLEMVAHFDNFDALASAIDARVTLQTKRGVRRYR